MGDAVSTDLMQQVRAYLINVYAGAAAPPPATGAPSAQPATPATAQGSSPAPSSPATTVPVEPLVLGQRAPVLAFEPIGMPVSPADFRLAQSDPASPMLASIGVQRTSQYSNWVPAIDASGTLQIGTRTVVGQFSVVLEESQPVDGANLTAFAALKAPVKQQFETALTSGLDTSGAGTSVQYYPVFPTPPDWYDPATAANWNSASFGTQPAPAPAPQPSGVPDPTGAPAPVPAGHGLFWRMTAHHELGVEPALAIRSTPFVRPMMMAPMMRAGNLSVAERISEPAAESRVDFMPRSDSWKALVQTSQAAPAQPAQSDGVAVAFDYCLVHLDRPWLSFDFLSSTGWFVPGVTAGALSDGSDLSGTLNFSAIPAAFIAIKNLKITANWTDADKAAAQSAVSLGAFGLTGAEFDGATLSNLGMQILAWICVPTPPLPPASDPALAAPQSTAVTPATPAAT